MKVRISIYEDNRKLREQLTHFINAQADLQVVGAFANGLHIERNFDQGMPDVVIMDIDMPGINGVEAVKICKQLHPEVQIIMYTVFEDDEKLFASLCAGADGYILKKSAPSALIDAIKDVYTGGVPLSPNIARKVLHTFKEKKISRSKYPLTKREVEVLTLLTKGFSYKQIAAHCYITLDTVRKHLQHIYTKLHVTCGTEAVAKALRHHIVTE